MGVLIGILVLSFLVFIHELGHFLVAKRLGVRVETFSIGFGPKLLKKRVGDTEYCLSAILFGGYVKMTGQEDLHSPEGDSEDAHDFRNKTIWERIQIALAGPLFNYVFAIFVLVGMYWTGIRQAPEEAFLTVGHVAENSGAEAAGFKAGDTLLEVEGKPVKDWQSFLIDVAISPLHPMEIYVGRKGGRKPLTLIPQKKGRDEIGWSGLYKTETIVVGEVLPASAALQAGIRRFDTLLTVGGKSIKGWDHLVEKISQSEGNPLDLEVKRSSGVETIRVQAAFDSTQKRYMVGIRKGAVWVTRRYGFFQSWGQAFFHTAGDAFMIWKFLKALVKRRVSVKSMAGPVGIVHFTGQIAKGGLDVLLLFIAMISVNLAIVNLFPFLIITDGGIIFFLLLEKMRGRPITLKKQIFIQQAALFFIVGFFVWVTFNDVLRLVGSS